MQINKLKIKSNKWKPNHLYNQFNEFSSELQKKTYSIMLMIATVLLWRGTHTHTNCKAVTACCWCSFPSEMIVRFQMQCNVIYAIIVGRCTQHWILLWFYWKWKIAMIMNNHLLYGNLKIIIMLHSSFSICLIGHYYIDVIAVVVFVAHILVRHRNHHFGILHTSNKWLHSWPFLFTLVFKVKFIFIWLHLYYSSVCVGNFTFNDLIWLVLF